MEKSTEQVILRPAEACRYLGMSRTTLHQLHERDLSFPRKIVFTPRCVGWKKHSLDAWLAKKEGGAL
jgi:predicted DNA-binding transcriptional regulator AlpA